MGSSAAEPSWGCREEVGEEGRCCLGFLRGGGGGGCLSDQSWASVHWGRPSPRLGDMRPGRRSQLRFLCDHGKATEGLGRDRRLHSPVGTCLLGSRPFEARGRRAGELGWEGRLTPKCPKCCQSVQSVVPSPFKTEGPSGEGGAGQSEQRGGLGLCPAQTRWLSLAGQKSHQALLPRCWILCLWHSRQLRFHLFRRPGGGLSRGG